MSASSPAGARYAALFAAESRTLLASAGAALAKLDGGKTGEQPVHAIDALFRAVHSLKGMAGAMEYAGVESLAHAVETVLARLRDGSVTAAPELHDVLVAAVDTLDSAIDAAIAGRSHDVSADVESLLLLATPVATKAAAPRARLVATAGTLVVRVRIESALPGVRATMIVSRLAALGTVEATIPATDALLGTAFDGTLVARVRTDAAPEAVEASVRGAGDVVDVRIETPVASAAAPEMPARADHVRVERTRLDALLDVAGELALARARLTAAAANIGDPLLAAAAADVARLVAHLHDEVRTARTAPAGEVFERLPRVVRDVARAVGKRAELVVEGGDVALDRAVLEELTDPLVHLLRNAVDHGLEAPHDRQAAGKPAAGRVVLRAEREGDAVLVRVRDDGRGIDRAKVEAMTGAHASDDDTLLSLIARPGFTTATKVSSVSGRGVGIDAVRDRVRRVGGTLTLESAPGEGTCFTIRLPLTLALGRALVARVGDERYALPIGHLRETADASPSMLVRDGARELLRLRDEMIPVIRLAAALGVARSGRSASDDEAPRSREAIVVDSGSGRVALIVDALDGQQDVLVKPLPPLRGAHRTFGGATILDDGTPALVLDAPALIRSHT